MSRYTEPLDQDIPWSLSSLQLHGDDFLGDAQDIAPPLHVSSTYRYPKKTEDLVPLWELKLPAAKLSNPQSHIYSRISSPTGTRLELLLEYILKGKVVTYASGVSAFTALLILLNPKRLCMSPGYSGCESASGIISRLSSMRRLPLDCDISELQEGDLLHLETPLNPTGEVLEIKKYADKAHSRGAFVSVDCSLAPPGLQDPFAWGADIVMHSGSKYLGGHSDIIYGVLAVRRDEWYTQLWKERIHLGSIIGQMEAWLAVRSLRTLDLRVERQTKNADELVCWLSQLLTANPEENSDARLVQAVVDGMKHASLQTEDIAWIKQQMPNGCGPLFAMIMKTEELAKSLPSKLSMFHHTCSFGAVESLIEWRKIADKKVDGRLLKVSAGIEHIDDLKRDLLNGFNAIMKDQH
ncbi:uncharacterized trans-sulfuration enzyme YHR112C [Aspergillus lentulus]|uniref:Uncharacterized trans-sulfuration enzyme YHR112C n=1 Tax=Aspergillus lentulus TaxID=293939 RepID=A0AAN4PCG7_ASPLE|nr:uncharacterized trans-sulfuration enzyme YHR112C [Aspergillus lentulus]